MKNVLITGVSTGIGRATAEDLLQRGYRVFGSVRKPADADRLASELSSAFTPLLFDVTDEAAIGVAAEQLTQEIGNEGLAGLVNNAGIAVAGPLMLLPLAEFRQQFEVNVIGVLAVTQAFLPLLGAQTPQTRPPGRIVHISSVSGTITYPFLGAYAASKRALEAIADAMRRELMVYGIEVSVVAPGSVRTPIWDKAEQIDMSPYAGTVYEAAGKVVQEQAVARGRSGLPIEVVVDAIRHALESPRPKTRYVLPRSRLMGWMIPRLLPARAFDRILAGRMGLQRKG